MKVESTRLNCFLTNFSEPEDFTLDYDTMMSFVKEYEQNQLSKERLSHNFIFFFSFLTLPVFLNTKRKNFSRNWN